MAPPSLASEPASSEPKIGPVQENETIANVSAMKNAPNNPPASAFLSILFANPAGRVISNNPKNERANTMKITKNTMFRGTLVEMSFRMFSLI